MQLFLHVLHDMQAFLVPIFVLQRNFKQNTSILSCNETY
jgi:hypothetical protein